MFFAYKLLDLLCIFKKNEFFMKFFTSLTSLCLASMLLLVGAAKCPPKKSNENNENQTVVCSSITDLAQCVAPSCKDLNGTCTDACSKVTKENCGTAGNREDCELNGDVCADKTQEMPKACAERSKEECGDGCKLLDGTTCVALCDGLVQADCENRVDCKYENDTCSDKTETVQKPCTERSKEECGDDCKLLSNGTCNVSCSNLSQEDCQKRADCNYDSDKCIDKPADNGPENPKVEPGKNCASLSKDDCNGTKSENNSVCVYNDTTKKCQEFPAGCSSKTLTACKNEGCLISGNRKNKKCIYPCGRLDTLEKCALANTVCKFENNKCVGKN